MEPDIRYDKTFERTINMALCANCDNESTYTVENLGTTTQTFCDEHLPKFYHKNRLPYNVRLIEEPVIEEVVVEKPKPARKKKSAAPAESAE
jgi:hypothetical protein